jgi:hypothetical protein
MCVEDARWNEVSEETSAAAAVGMHSGMHSAVSAVQPTVLRSSFLAARTLYFPSAPLATILAWLVASFSHCVCVCVCVCVNTLLFWFLLEGSFFVLSLLRLADLLPCCLVVVCVVGPSSATDESQRCLEFDQGLAGLEDGEEEQNVRTAT